MSAVCSELQFDALKKRAYRNIPRALLTAVIKQLPDYAGIVYLTLYDFAECNLRYPGTVMISYISLSKHLDKSVRSIGRALQKLKNEGFIEIQDKENSPYIINIIRVGCPSSLAEQIIHEEPERKNVFSLFSRAKVSTLPTQSSVVSKEAEQTETEAAALTTYHQPEPQHQANVALSDLPSVTPNAEPTDFSVEPIHNIEQLYQQYQQNIKKLRIEGLSPLNAARKAFHGFSNEQIIAIQQYILNQTHPQQLFSTPPSPKMSLPIDKNVHHIRINNNRAKHCLLLTKENPTSVDKLSANTSTGPNAVVNIKNEPSVNSYQNEALCITKKVRALYKYQEIHPALKLRYPNSAVLIQEVRVHVLYRDFDKTLDFKHALNAAAKMIRQGTWSTPRKILYWQSLRREREASYQKIQTQHELTTSKFYEMLQPFVHNLRYLAT